MCLSPNSFTDILDHTDLMGPRSDGTFGGPQCEVDMPCFDPIWPVLDNGLSPSGFDFGINTTPSMNQAFNHTTRIRPFAHDYLWNSDCDLLTSDHNVGALTDIDYTPSAEPIQPTPYIIGGQHDSTQVLEGMRSLQE